MRKHVQTTRNEDTVHSITALMFACYAMIFLCILMRNHIYFLALAHLLRSSYRLRPEQHPPIAKEILFALCLPTRHLYINPS